MQVWKHQPSNEEVACQYFMSLVRCRRPLQQQHVAREMAKKFSSKVQYQYWGIMSSIMQATEACLALENNKHKIFFYIDSITVLIRLCTLF